MHALFNHDIHEQSDKNNMKIGTFLKGNRTPSQISNNRNNRSIQGYFTSNHPFEDNGANHILDESSIRPKSPEKVGRNDCKS